MKNAPKHSVFHTNAFPKPNIPLPPRKKRPPSHHSPGASLSKSTKRQIYDSSKLRIHTLSVCSVYSVVGRSSPKALRTDQGENGPRITRNTQNTRISSAFRIQNSAFPTAFPLLPVGAADAFLPLPRLLHPLQRFRQRPRQG